MDQGYWIQGLSKVHKNAQKWSKVNFLQEHQTQFCLFDGIKMDSIKSAYAAAFSQPGLLFWMLRSSKSDTREVSLV